MNPNNRSTKSSLQEDNVTVYLILGFALLFVVQFLMHRYTQLFYHGWKVFFFPVIKSIAWLSTSVIGHVINPLLGTTARQAEMLVQFVSETPVAQWRFSGFIAMNHFIGKYFLLFLFPFWVYGTVFVFKHSQRVGPSFKKFKNSQALHRCLLSRDDFEEAKKMSETENNAALSCAQFCKQHGLLPDAKSNSQPNYAGSKAIFAALKKQLGDKFSERKEIFEGCYGWVARRIVAQIPLLYQEEAITYALQDHFYVSTALLSLLAVARCFGVVGIQPFLHLKQQNRALWYAFASLGRQVSFVEGAGIMAQFAFENQWKQTAVPESLRQLSTPLQIDSAVLGVIQAVMKEGADVTAHEPKSVTQYIKDRVGR